MNSYTLSFHEIDITKLAVVGGKGANLGELSRIDGISVPEGFCVTTEAFKNTTRGLSELLDRLAMLTVDDAEQVQEICQKIRHAIEGTPISQDIVDAITDQLESMGEKNSYAVRSSATAEDLPTASFAG